MHTHVRIMRAKKQRASANAKQRWNYHLGSKTDLHDTLCSAYFGAQGGLSGAAAPRWGP